MSIYRLQRLERIAYNAAAALAARFGVFERVFMRALRTAPDGRRHGRCALLVLCTGNICRSPFAAELLRRRLEEIGCSRVGVRSAGLETVVGAPADPSAVKIAGEFGTDLSDHATVPAAPEDLEEADLLIVMEPRHLRAVRRMSKASAAKLFLLGAGCVPGGGKLIIDDPYGKPDEAFRSCYRQIREAVEALAADLSAGLEQKDREK